MAKHKRDYDRVVVRGERIATSLGGSSDWSPDDEAKYVEAAAPEEIVPVREPETARDVVAELTIPIAAEVPSEFPIHLDVTLSPPAATVLRRIAMALDRQQARTSDGQRVVKPAQALRYMLEQLREA